MGTEFSFPITPEGAVTAPSGVFTFPDPLSISPAFHDIGPVNALEVPQFGWVLADGVNPLRTVARSGFYDAGGLAPSTAPTLAVTNAVKATAVCSYTGQPTATNVWILGRAISFEFVNALTTDGSKGNQVKISAVDAPGTYDNVEAFVMGTGTQGVEYFDYSIFRGFNQTVQERAFFIASNDGVDDITFTDTQYGTIGNTGRVQGTIANLTLDGGGTNFTGGTDGTGTDPAAGTYRYFYTWYRTADGAETGRSPIGTITQTTNTNIDVTVTASVDTTFDFVRIYRTEVGGVEFFLSGSLTRAEVVAATDYTDSISDTLLAVGVPWNDLLYRDYTEGMPPRGRALALWKDAVWTLGAHTAAEYTKGTVAVLGAKTDPDTASATVTFSALGVSELMVGRTFRVTATSEFYRILSVNEAAGTAVLDRKYENVDGAAVAYSIKDDYDTRRMQRSVQGKYNQWPVDESPGRVDTDDAEGGTALLATDDRLFGFSKDSIVSVTGDGPDTWVVNKEAQGVGCVAPRMVIGAAGGGLFLSHDGFYAISPDGSYYSISSPKAPKGTVAQGIDESVARIAWANVDQGYSEYDRADRIVIFGVPLDGATTPNYEFIFDLQNSVWALYKRGAWTALTRVVKSGGAQTLLSGDQFGHLWHVGIGESDGHYGAESVRTLTAATVRVLTDSSAAFTTTGDAEEGKPVLVLSADGETVQYGKVASNTGTALTLTEDLSTAPAVGDQIILGGIAWQAKSGFPTFGEEYRSKTLRSVTIRHAPTTRGDYHFSYAADGGDFQLCPEGTSVGDLTQKDGKITHRTQWPGDTHAINLRGFKPGGRATIRGGVFEFVIRELGRK